MVDEIRALVVWKGTIWIGRKEENRSSLLGQAGRGSLRKGLRVQNQGVSTSRPRSRVLEMSVHVDRRAVGILPSPRPVPALAF